MEKQSTKAFIPTGIYTREQIEAMFVEAEANANQPRYTITPMGSRGFYQVVDSERGTIWSTALSRSEAEFEADRLNIKFNN